MFGDEVDKKKGLKGLTTSLDAFIKTVEKLEGTTILDKLTATISAIDNLNKNQVLEKLEKLFGGLDSSNTASSNVFSKLSETLEKLSKLDINIKYDSKEIQTNFTKLQEINTNLNKFIEYQSILLKDNTELITTLSSSINIMKSVNESLIKEISKIKDIKIIQNDSKIKELVNNMIKTNQELTNKVENTNKLLANLSKPKKATIQRDLQGELKSVTIEQ